MVKKPTVPKPPPVLHPAGPVALPEMLNTPVAGAEVVVTVAVAGALVVTVEVTFAETPEGGVEVMARPTVNAAPLH
ncbi:MAG TPA: hypothetical protein VGQ11_03760 [Candidatus Acidoferrales bacterium]|nr:hypothetical protein [Candidatus Acidoferrales bacterium]